METKELIKKMLTESRNMLTEENILPIFAYLYKRRFLRGLSK